MEQSDHFKIICSVCTTIINQCRCMCKDKKVDYIICANCKHEKAKIEDNWYMIKGIWYHCITVDGRKYVDGVEQK